MKVFCFDFKLIVLHSRFFRGHTGGPGVSKMVVNGPFQFAINDFFMKNLEDRAVERHVTVKN